MRVKCLAAAWMLCTIGSPTNRYLSAQYPAWRIAVSKICCATYTFRSPFPRATTAALADAKHFRFVVA